MWSRPQYYKFRHNPYWLCQYQQSQFWTSVVGVAGMIYCKSSQVLLPTCRNQNSDALLKHDMHSSCCWCIYQKCCSRHEIRIYKIYMQIIEFKVNLLDAGWLGLGLIGRLHTLCVLWKANGSWTYKHKCRWECECECSCKLRYRQIDLDPNLSAKPHFASRFCLSVLYLAYYHSSARAKFTVCWEQH